MSNTKNNNTMTTIQLTSEIRKEIIGSIATIQKWIDKENAISSDLRNHDKVSNWITNIKRLNSYLIQGYINL